MVKLTNSRQVALACMALSACVSLTSVVHSAGLPPEKILQRMFQADRQVAFRGEEVTVLYTPKGQRVLRQMVQHRPPDLMRVEFLYPPAMRGQLIVSDGRFRWRYLPQRHQVIKTPRLRRTVKPPTDPQRKELRKKNFNVAYLGEDSVAGRRTYVVAVQPNEPGPPLRKFWVDQSTFLKLKMQQVDTNGVIRESTEFEKIELNPTFAANTFTFTPPPGARIIETPANPQRRVFKSLIELQKQTPFPLQTPRFVPKGFEWEGGTVMQQPQRPAVAWMRYTDGLNTLSLFERQDPRAKGNTPPRPARRGAIVWVRNGINLVLVGNLPVAVMMRIADSVQ